MTEGDARFQRPHHRILFVSRHLSPCVAAVIHLAHTERVRLNRAISFAFIAAKLKEEEGV